MRLQIKHTCAIHGTRAGTIATHLYRELQGELLVYHRGTVRRTAYTHINLLKIPRGRRGLDRETQCAIS